MRSSNNLILHTTSELDRCAHTPHNSNIYVSDTSISITCNPPSRKCSLLGHATIQAVYTCNNFVLQKHLSQICTNFIIQCCFQIIVGCFPYHRYLLEYGIKINVCVQVRINIFITHK